MTEFQPCWLRSLPEEHKGTAAALAININPSNAPNQSRSKAEEPVELAVKTSKMWNKNGVELSVSFIDTPDAELRTRILSHMNAWSEYCNVRFFEVTSNAQVRISRNEKGYWSYLGTDILLIPSNKATMNLGGFSMETPESEYRRVVRHETGHTLGFAHEHLRSEIVNYIDHDKLGGCILWGATKQLVEGEDRAKCAYSLGYQGYSFDC